MKEKKRRVFSIGISKIVNITFLLKLVLVFLMGVALLAVWKIITGVPKLLEVLQATTQLEIFTVILYAALFAFIVVVFYLLREKKALVKGEKKSEKPAWRIKEAWNRTVTFFQRKKIAIEKEHKIPPGTKLRLGTYETAIDALYQKIQDKGKMSLEEVMNTFKVNKELAEEWIKILESHHLITITYPPFKPLVVTPYKEEKKEEKE